MSRFLHFCLPTLAQKATDWVATSSPGMVSGSTQGPPAASCTYEFDTDLAGGDILTADGVLMRRSLILSAFLARFQSTAARDPERALSIPQQCTLQSLSNSQHQRQPQQQQPTPCTHLTHPGTDTVVSTFSDADCCQSCARTPGCGAWTMTPPSNCADSLGPNIVGCCFLKASSAACVRDQGILPALSLGVMSPKHPGLNQCGLPSYAVHCLPPPASSCHGLQYSSGWTRTEDPDGVMTSGELLSTGRR